MTVPSPDREAEIRAALAVEKRLERSLSLVGWYRRCLEGVEAGKIVRGLGEAKAGYESALAALAASPEEPTT